MPCSNGVHGVECPMPLVGTTIIADVLVGSFFGGAPRQGAEPTRVGLSVRLGVCVSVCLSVCLCVCVSVCNKKYFQSSALTPQPQPFRDLRFKTWPRKLCSATLTLSQALEMASRARPQDVSGTRDLGSVSQKLS